MMLPKVSVIIPVYNVKKEYMEICVGSILKQTYQNIEIILVDDGSKSEFGKYCDVISEKDSRIKVIHTENKGVSAARNLGTEFAEGTYIMYVDADDVVAPYSIEHGVKAIEDYDADMAIGAVQKINRINQFYVKDTNYSGPVKIIEGVGLSELRCLYLNDPKNEYVKIDKVGYINRGPNSRIIKRSIANSNLFPEGFPLGEDVIWNMRLLNLCRRVCIVNEIWYGYMIYAASAVRKYYGNREHIVSCYLKVLEKENKKFCAENMDSFARNVFMEYYCLLRYEYMSEKCEMTCTQKIKKAKEVINSEPWNILKNRKAIANLPIMHRIIIESVRFGGWIGIFHMWELRNKYRSKKNEI